MILTSQKFWTRSSVRQASRFIQLTLGAVAMKYMTEHQTPEELLVINMYHASLTPSYASSGQRSSVAVHGTKEFRCGSRTCIARYLVNLSKTMSRLIRQQMAGNEAEAAKKAE